MSFFLNRKRSGMVLTGVVLSSGVVSAVNQGVAGANDTLVNPKSPGVNGNLLEKFAGKDTKRLFLNDIKVIFSFFSIILVGYIICVVVSHFISGRSEKKNNKEIVGNNINNDIDKKGEDNNIVINNENGIEENNKTIKIKEGNDIPGGDNKNNKAEMKSNNNEKKEDNIIINENKNKKEEMPFSKVFCYSESKTDYTHVKAWEKIKKFEGCVYEVSMQELKRICIEAYVGDFEKILQVCDKDKDKIKIKISNVRFEKGYLRLVVLGEKNKCLGGFCTKYATTNAVELDSLVNYLSGNKVSGKTPFSKVFCSGASWNERDTEDISNWKELRKFEGKTLNIEIKELRLIVDDIEDLDEKISKKHLKGVIKVKIGPICNGGYSKLDVLGKNSEESLFTVNTKYAVKDDNALKELVEYLEKKTENENNNGIKNENNVENNKNSNVINNKENNDNDEEENIAKNNKEVEKKEKSDNNVINEEEANNKNVNITENKEENKSNIEFVDSKQLEEKNVDVKEIVVRTDKDKEVVSAMLALRDKENPDEKEFLKMLDGVSKILDDEPAMLSLDGDDVVYKIIGDIHGNVAALEAVIADFIETRNSGKKVGLIFNGDFSDDRNQCPHKSENDTMKVWFLLMKLKVLFPKDVFLLRGNHEADHCISLGGENVQNLYKEVVLMNTKGCINTEEELLKKLEKDDKDVLNNIPCRFVRSKGAAIIFEEFLDKLPVCLELKSGGMLALINHAAPPAGLKDYKTLFSDMKELKDKNKVFTEEFTKIYLDLDDTGWQRETFSAMEVLEKIEGEGIKLDEKEKETVKSIKNKCPEEGVYQELTQEEKELLLKIYNKNKVKLEDKLFINKCAFSEDDKKYGIFYQIDFSMAERRTIGYQLLWNDKFPRSDYKKGSRENRFREAGMMVFRNDLKKISRQCGYTHYINSHFHEVKNGQTSVNIGDENITSIITICSPNMNVKGNAGHIMAIENGKISDKKAEYDIFWKDDRYSSKGYDPKEAEKYVKFVEFKFRDEKMEKKVEHKKNKEEIDCNIININN